MRLDARKGDKNWRVWCCKRRIWMNDHHAVIWVDDITQEIGYWSTIEAWRAMCKAHSLKSLEQITLYGLRRLPQPEPDTVEKCPIVTIMAGVHIVWINVGHDVHTNDIEHYTERQRVQIHRGKSPIDLLEELRKALGPGVTIKEIK